MALKRKDKIIKTKAKKYSRRDFVAGSGTVLAGGALVAYTPDVVAGPGAQSNASGYSAAAGYLVYDSRRCAGCQSCMLACSLVHEGEASTSLSRIQVSRAVLMRYPYDIQISVCRQCPEPMCVKNCPTGACHVSAAHGNVRMIDEEKCIGCGTCLKACPYSPHRTIWRPGPKKSTKCDLCVGASYFSKKGGPAGDQACVTTCPMGAIKLIAELPSQTDISGYDVDLAPPSPPSKAQPSPTAKAL